MLWQGFGGPLFPCNLITTTIKAHNATGRALAGPCSLVIAGEGGWVSPQSGVGFRLVCNYELESKCWNMPDFVGVQWYIGYTRNRVLAVRNFSFGTEFPLTNQGIFRFL